VASRQRLTHVASRSSRARCDGTVAIGVAGAIMNEVASLTRATSVIRENVEAP